MEKGASLCVLTDKGMLVRAEVTKADARSYDSLLDFSLTQWPSR
ncbi:hypothetical protein ACFV3R_31075 [Streptomyces sp. NPDC059740]